MKIGIRTLALLLLMGAAAAAGIAHFGLYDIAATEQHTKPVYLLLDHAMRKSVSKRAEGIAVPDLSGEPRIHNGLAHYRAHCLQCHGAPGVAPEPFSYGMTPAPASMVITAREWPPAELFWTVKHGIKMSGMPAWEYRLSDAEIWDVVAFVRRLPALSPQAYRELSRQVPPLHASAEPAGLPGAPAKDALAAGPMPGDAEAGKRALQQHLCLTCHEIPGVVGQNAPVGPPLNGIAGRRYIGGVLPNTPENMVRWLQNPQQFDPLSAMPNLQLSEKDARDMAAFLYTLEDLD